MPRTINSMGTKWPIGVNNGLKSPYPQKLMAVTQVQQWKKGLKQHHRWLELRSTSRTGLKQNLLWCMQYTSFYVANTVYRPKLCTHRSSNNKHKENKEEHAREIRKMEPAATVRHEALLLLCQFCNPFSNSNGQLRNLDPDSFSTSSFRFATYQTQAPTTTEPSALRVYTRTDSSAISC